jgi:hypothetical protein
MKGVWLKDGSSDRDATSVARVFRVSLSPFEEVAGRLGKARRWHHRLGVVATVVLIAFVQGAGVARPETVPYKIAETTLWVGGVSAAFDTSTLVAPKDTASAVRVKIIVQDRELDAPAVVQLLGGAFTLWVELRGPGFWRGVSLPVANAPALADPFLIPIPALPVGEYSLTAARVIVDGKTVLDVQPLQVAFKVIDRR